MSENRCNRCNRKLQSPSATYGSTCARIMGVREAYEQSDRNTRDDFDHSAHVTADKLRDMNVNWATEDGRVLYQQLFAQEFSGTSQVIPAKDSKGTIEQTLRSKDTDYQLINLSNKTETIGVPTNESSAKAVNYRTTEQSGVKAMDHLNSYDKGMSAAEKAAWTEDHRSNLKLIEQEYSEENLKNREYGSIVDLRIEYDRLYNLNCYAMSAQRNTGENGEYLPPELRQETLAVTRRAMYNMEKDMIARTIYMEADNDQESINAVAQTIINRQHLLYSGNGKALCEIEGTENDSTLIKFVDRYNGLEAKRFPGEEKPIQNAVEVLPGMATYGGKDGNDYYMYSTGGLLLASGQYSGLTGDHNDPAMQSYANASASERRRWDMAHAAADKVMRGEDAHGELADLGWTQFRGSHGVTESGNTITIGDSGDTYTGKNKRWKKIGGNYYIDYGNPDK